MPQVDLSLPHVRRVAAVVLTLAALLAGTTSAYAHDAGSTGGTAAETKASKKKKSKRKKSVRQIQKALGIRADGVMGPKTRRAIKRFQRRNGLEVDGVAGPQTLRALGLLDEPAAGKLEGVDPAVVLSQIAECESGGDPTAVSANRKYRGKYQFSRATWRDMGGEGDPADAPEAEQDARALKLYEQRGIAPWPTCGAKVDV